MPPMFIASIMINSFDLRYLWIKGVPHLLRAKFQAVKKALLDLEPLPPFHNIVLRLTTADETHIAPILKDVAKAAGVDVEIGSYPVCITPV